MLSGSSCIIKQTSYTSIQQHTKYMGFRILTILTDSANLTTNVIPNSSPSLHKAGFDGSDVLETVLTATKYLHSLLPLPHPNAQYDGRDNI